MPDEITDEAQTDQQESVGVTPSELFGAAYDGALQGSLYAAEQSGEADAAVVALDEGQWAYVQSAIQLQDTCALLSCLLLAAVLGLLVWREVSEGWRR